MTRSIVTPQSMWDTIRSQVVRTVGNIFTRSFLQVSSFVLGHFKEVIDKVPVIVITNCYYKTPFFSATPTSHWRDRSIFIQTRRTGRGWCCSTRRPGSTGGTWRSTTGLSRWIIKDKFCNYVKFLLILQGINTVELDLQKIRDPLQIHVPAAKKGDKSLGAGGGFFGINNLRDVISKLQWRKQYELQIWPAA